jgi:hypothetical protein
VVSARDAAACSAKGQRCIRSKASFLVVYELTSDEMQTPPPRPTSLLLIDQDLSIVLFLPFLFLVSRYLRVSVYLFDNDIH